MANTPETTLRKDPGHPWFYVLGGRPMYPSDIKAAVRENGHIGWMYEDIKAAAALAEPQRSEALRAMREIELRRLCRDISIYRKSVGELRSYRRTIEPALDERSCADVHVSMSLKLSHLINGFAHLLQLDDLLAEQRDLFGGL